MEHVDLYGIQGDVPSIDLDYVLPFGKASVRREGADVTVLTCLWSKSRWKLHEHPTSMPKLLTYAGLIVQASIG